MMALHDSDNEPINGWSVHVLDEHLERTFKLRDERDEARFKIIEQVAEEREKRYEQRFSSSDSAVSAAILSAKEAVTKAEIATEKRFDSVNEFRAALADQTLLLATKAEMDARLALYDEKLISITNSVEDANLAINRVCQTEAGTEGRHTGMGVVVAYAVGGAGVLIAIISVLLRIAGI